MNILARAQKRGRGDTRKEVKEMRNDRETVLEAIKIKPMIKSSTELSYYTF